MRACVRVCVCVCVYVCVCVCARARVRTCPCSTQSMRMSRGALTRAPWFHSVCQGTDAHARLLRACLPGAKRARRTSQRHSGRGDAAGTESCLRPLAGDARYKQSASKKKAKKRERRGAPTEMLMYL